jgi:hypothetical protein
MPRRTVQKCGRRHAGGSLGTTDELCLTQGHAFGVADWEEPLQSPAEFRRLWSRWGAEITRRWIEAYPGSRPIGVYLAGEIEPPAWRHRLATLRHPVRLGREVAIEDRSWHTGEIELDHLDRLGLIGDEERRQATERLGEPAGGHHGRYRGFAAD